MITRQAGRAALVLMALAFAAILGLASTAAADEHVKGVITVRGDALFTMQTEDGASMIVTLKETTEIRTHEGTKMHASELIPGLRVDVEGFYDSGNRLVADQVKFKEADRKLALAIKAGLTPTDQEVARHGVTLQEHAQTIDTHGQTLQKHGTDLVDHDQRIVATTGAIKDTNERIGNLDDFNVVEQMTVYFKNGQAIVAPEYKDQLIEFAVKAKAVHGYVMQVQGYASAVGPRTFNDVLSQKRADAVTMLLQQAGIPTTNFVVPAAMGISEQVAENNTRAGQKQNRRVVVTILENKGIAAR